MFSIVVPLFNEEKNIEQLLSEINKSLINYDWFKFLHHKPAVNNLTRVKDQNNYLYPNASGNSIFLGEKRISRVWHYFEKELNVRNT